MHNVMLLATEFGEQSLGNKEKELSSLCHSSLINQMVHYLQGLARI
jgi:hypothetical protein